LQEEDIVLVLTRPIIEGGIKAARIEKRYLPILLNQRVGKFSIKQTDRIDKRFLYFLIFSKRFIELVKQRVSVTHQPNISSFDIEKFQILLPKIKEQQKIASILSNVDELIQKTDQIIEQTRTLKQGLMQKLLTKGIEHSKFKKINLGINFLNYEVPIDWKLLKIKDIASVHGRIGWKGLKREEYMETGPLMLSVWSLTDDYPYGVDYSAGVNRLSTFRFDESPEIKLKNGDVLLAKDGDIGRIGYVKSLPEPTTVNSHVVVVRTKNDIINNEFLYWFMSSNPFQTYCKSFTSGTTVPLLSQSNIREAVILIPSLSEQNAISSTLYSFSNIIHKHRIYKNKIQEIKRGLMQQLLTGKIRVKV
jgi:type I restriction enzyme, S subunit